MRPLRKGWSFWPWWGTWPRQWRSGGRGRRSNPEYFNGVDISDPNRMFTDAEFRKLGREGRELIRDRRHRGNRNNNGGSGNNQPQQNDDRTIQQLNIQNGGTNNADAASVLTDNSGAIVPYSSGTNHSQDARNRGGNNGDSIGRRTAPGG